MSFGDTSPPPRLGPLGSSLKVALPGGAEIVRSALRDGRAVVTLRSVDNPTGATIECTVRPADPQAAPQILGPYTFDSHAEARRFGDELMLALEYLGCELVESDGETVGEKG